MARRPNNTEARDYPLVNVQRIKLEAFKCEVDSRQLEKMGRYINYVHEIGGEKPTQGEVVGAALEELFRLDKGFAEWEARSPKPADSQHNKNRSGAPHATS
jgi:hypothetical protein